MSAFIKAERKKARLRLGLFGPAGSGKTYSALRIAKGLGGRIAMIDTEAGSGELYSKQFDYFTQQIAAPFTPEKYIEAIRAAEAEGFATVVIDSLSHAWAGTGGILDIQGKAADKSRNSYTAWRDVTPRHNELVEAILQSKCHVIVTMRSKTEYVLEEDERGKKVPKKVGMAPVQRDGMEYEMTVCAEIDDKHEARFSKDRTAMFSKQDWTQLTEETGEKLRAWLEDGKDEQPAKPVAPPAKAAKAAKPPVDVAGALDEMAAIKKEIAALLGRHAGHSGVPRLPDGRFESKAYSDHYRSVVTGSLDGRANATSLDDFQAIKKNLEAALATIDEDAASRTNDLPFDPKE